MLTLGVFHGRIAAWGERRSHLRVTADDISLPVRPFSRLTLAWQDVDWINIDDRYATIRALDGREQRIDLTDLLHASAVRDAIMQARRLLDQARHATSASIESTAASS